MAFSVVWMCPICRAAAEVRADRFPVHCRCGFVQLVPEFGLGDWVAAVLHTVGITPKRYKRLKAWLGLPPRCRCRSRQRRLNDFGRAASRWWGRLGGAN